jgi:WD40 repeat protein
VGRAVQDAHEQGVVHRDLKPANILLAADVRVGEPGKAGALTPKITDVGLARLTDGGAGLTGSDTLLGTPAYMAPEQASGSRVGPAADTWALGVVLYECLTGRPPFVADSPALTLQRVVLLDPVSPSHLQPGVPRDLETICLKCLHKEPGRRYASAAALADDLDRFLAGRPILARPVSAAERGWKWVRRNPLAAFLLAAVVAVLLTGTGVVLGLAGWALDNARQAAAGERRTRRQLYVARVRLIHGAWRDGRLARMRSLIEEEESDPGPADLHGFEWFYLRGLLACDQGTFHAPFEGSKEIRDVRFSADGSHLLARGVLGAEVRWDLRGGQQEVVPANPEAPVERPPPVVPIPPKAVWQVLGPGGGQVAAGSDDGTVRVWDARTGELLHTLDGLRGPVRALAVSPDCQRLAAGGADRVVLTWDLRTGREALPRLPHQGTVWALAFSPDGGRLAAAISNLPTPAFGAAQVGDARTGQELLTLRVHDVSVSAVAFSPDGRRLATADVQGTVKLWDALTGQESIALDGEAQAIWRVAVSPDGRRLATSTLGGAVRVRDVAGRRQERSFSVANVRLWNGVAFSPDGRRVAACGEDGLVHVWQCDGGEEVLTLRAGTQGPAFSPDGRVIAVGSEDGAVTLDDAVTGREGQVLRGHSKGVRGLASQPGGGRLASASLDGTVRVWDIGTGREVLTLSGHASGALRVAFSPDGRRLVSCGGDEGVRLWDATTGREERILRGHSGHVCGAVFSPDGGLVASAGNDGVVRLWDVETGQELLDLPGHGQAVFGVAFAPDGTWLASCGEGGTVRLWQAPRQR